jgi:alpha-tubulin suppressor-like RCC1 family protein
LRRSNTFFARSVKQAFVGILAIGLAGVACGADVISLWGGARGTIVLKSDGTVWTWGANFEGKLGIGETNTVRALVPVEVHGAGNVSYLNSVVSIMGGETHNMAVKADGTLWSWGYNFVGELGDGTTNDAAVPIQVGLGSTPPLTHVTKLGGRTYFSLAVKSDGTIWGWGMNSSGQMGNGTTGPNVLTPVMVSNSQPGGAVNNPLQVSCGYTYGLALLTNGTVWTWGTGIHGELGAGTTFQSLLPTQAVGLTNITAISSGWKHSLALKSDGSVWAWGLNSHGELGDGTAINRSNAVQVLNVSNIVAVSGGDYNSIALRADGTVWKWGVNDVGELGMGTNDGTASGVANDFVVHAFPAQVMLDKFGNGFSNVVKVANRDYHNIAVKADGSVWMWGANDQGQCGDGTTNDLYRPSPVVGMGARVPLPLSIKRSAQAGSLDLSWSSATGEYFTIEYATNLLSGFTGILQTNILATPPANVVTVGATNGNRYYRLRF